VAESKTAVVPATAARGPLSLAEVLPFPLSRRRDLIARQARRFVEQQHAAAEANLAHQMRVQRDVLLRKGVEPSRVNAECLALERAIRAAVWRIARTAGGTS